MRKPSLLLLALFFLKINTSAQTLPVGTSYLEETWRRMQVKGEKDLNVSFAVRPTYFNSEKGVDSSNNSIVHKLKNFNKGFIGLLPINLSQQYNTNHSYGWNDGSMIPARGYQNQLSLGIYSKLGPFILQLRPEFVYAQNKNFQTFPESYNDTLWKYYYTDVLNKIDAPEKFGNGYYAKIFAGQSSFRFNYEKLSLGVSTENLWWGPGIRNSLIMSNNAPGFLHLSFNTTNPVLSSIGSFEWQVIAGDLRNSNIFPTDTSRTFDGQKLYIQKNNSDRYLNGLIFVYQPKWTKGLYLGFTRLFYLYKTDRKNSLDGYFPVLGHFFKGGTRNEDALKRDQILSLFFRFVFSESKAEVYAEYGRNDHSQNARDLLLEPDHSRAYIIGTRKIFDTKKTGKQFEIMTELTSLQIPITIRVRPQEEWYAHYQVRHGYTNLGQVIGAGIGPGASSQTLQLNWIKQDSKFGGMFERIVHNNDFYYDAFSSSQDYKRHWVDLAFSLNKSWQKEHFIYDVQLAFVHTLNYEWQINYDPNMLHAMASVSYVF